MSDCPPLQNRAADRAGKWLRMEPPIKRIGIFRGAVMAQRETIERRIGPVVGQRADQRIAWPALRAIDERITIAAGSRVAQLGQTVITCEQVWRYVNLRLLPDGTRQNPEIVRQLGAYGAHIPQPRDRGGRRSRQQCLPELPKTFSRPLHVNFDLTAVFRTQPVSWKPWASR